jgi:hypothetical protein
MDLCFQSFNFIKNTYRELLILIGSVPILS